MHPGMYGSYDRRPGLSAAPPDAVTTEGGVQRVTSQKRNQIMENLGTLYSVLAPTPPQGADPAVTAAYNAVPCSDAEAAGGFCAVTALAFYRSAPATTLYLVNVTSASPTFVEVIATTDPSYFGRFAVAGSDFAAIDFAAPIAKAEEKETPYSTKVLGMLAGGTAGFFVGGPVGAAVGVGVGYVAADAIG